LSRVLSVHPALAAANVPMGAGAVLSVPNDFAEMSPALVALALVLVTAGVWLASKVIGGGSRIRVGETWGCGRVVQTARMEYTSTAFAEPLRRVFAEMYRPTEDLSIDFHPDSRYFVQAIEYRTEILPWFERYLYGPLIAWLRRRAGQVRALQSGSAHAYLTYLVVALVGLLTWLLVRSA
jgi:hypothetical protein